ncbi:MAG: hypothetical protein JF599_03135 [Verrucomicrobia bacterium]|nr:hypothetical protein [Verrucomicrobiota bacterium]
MTNAFLSGYAIQRREFAAAFRSAFAELASWSHVSTDYGSANADAGVDRVGSLCFEDDVMELAHRFMPLAQLVDALLDQRVK